MTLPRGERPARHWYDSLDKKGRGQFAAACATVETTLASGRPPAGRLSKVANSSHGLLELRVTKKGSTPPHLRALVVRERRTLWVATGITKTSNRLDTRDIDEADRITEAWRGDRA